MSHIQCNFFIGIVTGTKRRSYKGIAEEIPNYFKKPKITEMLLPLGSELWADNIQAFEKYQLLDHLYLLSHTVGNRTPMWVGFDSLNVIDNSKQQKVIYLPPINESPNDKKVVMETLRRTQIISQKCEDVYGQVCNEYNSSDLIIKFPI